ncbi:MAG: 3-hydroxyacyl-CoA dehydrogenase NAD-binding domain-containing protein, partial [Pseudomonadota bacterium]|nr:3-hydroxyacyl-CoA dehydrogenase NAD-binding domain-containing protein [Pseudomonadota bacterium]
MIDKIGIVGAGQMGGGIAHVCSLARLDVTLLDIEDAVLARAVDTIRGNLARQVSRGKIAEGEAEAAVARIATTTDYASFAACDAVVEAATENEEIKRAVFQSMLPHLRDDALIASNTSSISITRLAAGTDRPERFIGLHFMNPVPVMKLVEIIRGIATDQPTFDAFNALADRLDKTVAVAEDFPAFIVNRILLPMINEAVYTLYEGVGSV